MKIAEALQVLGVNKESTEQEVKQAYKDLARIWHPDRFQGDERLGAKTEAQIKLINEAKTVALDYLKKHGHFRFVRGDAGSGSGTGTTPNYDQPPKPWGEYEVKDTPPREDPRARPRPKAKPEPEPAPEPEPEPEPRHQPEPESIFDDDAYDYGNPHDTFLPDSSVLIAAILVIVLIGFIFIMASSMSDSPKDKVEAYLKKRNLQNPSGIEKQVEKLKIVIEEDSLEANEAEPEPAFADSFFTLGSDKLWVSMVQGPPYQIKGTTWRYGFSSIVFEGDSVIGWTSSELNPLSVGMLLDSSRVYGYSIFGIGSWKDEVAALQGAPDIIDGNLWIYGDATVRFNADTVISFVNDQQNRLLTE
ncbi:MAG: DnaJ domain-containing protein [Candidatus Marinimicrobia bacterium]|nr:DnaJ domain-containing protein [Candidatus Neomarinimicrobiota bacterium]